MCWTWYWICRWPICWATDADEWYCADNLAIETYDRQTGRVFRLDTVASIRVEGIWSVTGERHDATMIRFMREVHCDGCRASINWWFGEVFAELLPRSDVRRKTKKFFSSMWVDLDWSLLAIVPRWNRTCWNNSIPKYFQNDDVRRKTRKWRMNRGELDEDHSTLLCWILMQRLTLEHEFLTASWIASWQTDHASAWTVLRINLVSLWWQGPAAFSNMDFMWRLHRDPMRLPSTRIAECCPRNVSQMFPKDNRDVRDNCAFRYWILVYYR